MFYVSTTIENKIAEIEFFNEASNSLNSEQLEKLSKQILEAGQNDQVHVIHLKSGGNRAFCAGASFDELLEVKDVATGTTFFMGFANVVNSIRTCGKIVVTSIQGKTVGGGVGIAAASDYVLATKFASVKLSELSISIGPFVVEPAITRAVGIKKLSELSLNPTVWKSPEWCYHTGLYDEVFENTQEMEDRVKAYLKEMACYNPEALGQMKKVLWQNTEHWDALLKERAAISGQLVLSEAAKSVLQKFKKK